MAEIGTYSYQYFDITAIVQQEYFWSSQLVCNETSKEMWVNDDNVMEM